MTQKMEHGFTMLELMIVVVIISLLAAVAIPSYSQYIVRANRSDAQDKLSEVAFEQERFANRNRRYTLDMQDLGYAPGPAGNLTSTTSGQGLYLIDAAVCAGATVRTCVVMTATPVAGGRQAGTGTLGLDTRGTRTGEW